MVDAIFLFYNNEQIFKHLKWKSFFDYSFIDLPLNEYEYNKVLIVVKY